MKKLIIIVQLLILSYIVAAQTQYIDYGTYKIDNTLTFKCRRGVGVLMLTDKSRENEQVPTWDPIWNTFSRKNGKIVSNANMLKAFTESFTRAQIDNLAAKGETISLFVYWNSSGDIISINLGMADNVNMQSISPETYGALFKKLKQYVKFKIVSANYTQPYYYAVFDITFDEIKRGYIDFD